MLTSFYKILFLINLLKKTCGGLCFDTAEQNVCLIFCRKPFVQINLIYQYLILVLEAYSI